MPNVVELTYPDITILSVTKPITQKEYICAWSHEPNTHIIPKGHKHVRVVYEDKNGDMKTDRICVECWTK